MKVQVDSNNYLTGSYSLVGNLSNSIEMDKLPDSDVVYFTAYKILSKTEYQKVIVNKEVKKTRNIRVPIIGEDGNETGEYEIIPEEYSEIEPVEEEVPVTIYYYELDTTKKQQIQDKIDNPDPPDTSDDWKLQYQKMQDKILAQSSNIEYIALMTDVDIWNM